MGTFSFQVTKIYVAVQQQVIQINVKFESDILLFCKRYVRYSVDKIKPLEK